MKCPRCFEDDISGPVCSCGYRPVPGSARVASRRDLVEDMQYWRNRTSQSEAETVTRFDPIVRTRKATITKVESEGDAYRTVHFAYAVGGKLGGKSVGTAVIHVAEWPAAYWPPAAGDTLKVEEKPTITLQDRPRTMKAGR